PQEKKEEPTEKEELDVTIHLDGTEETLQKIIKKLTRVNDALRFSVNYNVQQLIPNSLIVIVCINPAQGTAKPFRIVLKGFFVFLASLSSEMLKQICIKLIPASLSSAHYPM